MEAIARKYLTLLQSRTAALGTQLQFSEELPAYLGKMGKGKGGARTLRRLVQEQVEGPLAAYLLGCSRKPGKILASFRGEKICFQS